MGMNKKRKTRKKKVLSDLHRKLYLARVVIPSVKEETADLREKIKIPQPAIVINNYPYLVKDITNTAFVTVLIIAFQIFLFLMLKFHVITLPGINY